MKSFFSSANHSTEERPVRAQPDTRWHGRLLWPARIAWLLLLALIVTLLAVNAPTNVIYARNEYMVQQAREAILAFTSLQTFAEWLVTIRWLVVAAYFTTALLIAWRRWDDSFALLVSAALLLLAWGFVMRGDRSTWLYPRLLLPLASTITFIVGQLPVLGLMLMFFLFPNGRFVFNWHKWLALLTILATALFFHADEYRLLWLDYRQLLERWAWPIWSALLLGSLLVALTGQIYRYRHLATPEQRQQMKWVLFGLAGMLAIPLLSWPLEDAGGSWGTLAAIGVDLTAATFLPLTIGFSILRYRLWDVDLIINRALVYGGLTAVILTFYGLSVGILSALMPGRADLLISVVALSVAAVTAIPARRFLRNWVDRLMPAPSAPPAVRPEDAPATRPTGIPWRLAHIAWVGLFVFLLWQLVVRLSEIPDILTATQADYLVRTSLQLLPASAAIPFVTYVTALRIGVTAVFWLTATVIFWRKRNDWFALYVSFLLMLAPFGLVLGGSENELLASISFVAVGAQLFLPFLFPDGRFIPRSTRRRILLAGLLLFTAAVVYPITRLVLAGYNPSEWVYVTFIFTVAVMMAAGLASQVYRYRRVADAVQRQQMKWVLVGFGVSFLWILWGVLWLSGILARLNISEAVIALVMIHLAVLASAALPVTIGFSILRYRLWQVDLVINRALVFGGLTLLVTAVYILVVGILGVFFQAGGNLLLSILATGLIAILFHPLRQRLQQAVNRLMYGERDDPATVLSRLGKRLEETTVPGDILPALVETIAQTLKLPYVAIEIDDSIVASVGAVGEPSLHKYPLIYQSQPIGHLLVATRAGGDTFTLHEEQLLRNVARQAGPAIYAEQLTSQLQRSRQRLVTTREEERRRLRRDLHDGLGPQLATLTIKVNAAQNLLRKDPDTADQLLDEVRAESQSAIKEIRRVVQGLRPSALDQLGLLSALREFAAQNGDGHTQITFRAAETLPPLPAAVEVAAYRIATEAITNAVRHAQARKCTLTLEANETLHLEIRDDGDGLPPDYVPGIGLSSMRERALELGGTFEIRSDPGQGTNLSVRLPLTRSE